METFLHAADALAARTATIDGRPVGHGCRVAPPTGHPGSLYESTGWNEVPRIRPGWWREATGDQTPDVRVPVLPS